MAAGPKFCFCTSSLGNLFEKIMTKILKWFSECRLCYAILWKTFICLSWSHKLIQLWKKYPLLTFKSPFEPSLCKHSCWHLLLLIGDVMHDCMQHTVLMKEFWVFLCPNLELKTQHLRIDSESLYLKDSKLKLNWNKTAKAFTT